MVSRADDANMESSAEDLKMLLENITIELDKVSSGLETIKSVSRQLKMNSDCTISALAESRLYLFT